ncbi:MAG: GyrI-like domain-containing protein [Gemmatimonadales bacterium]
MSSYDAHLRQLSAVPVAVVRRRARRTDLARLVPEGCGLVWEFLHSHQLKGGRNVAIYWDGSIRLEVGVECDQELPGGGEVFTSATPAGPTASVVHFGPYQQLGAAHAAIQHWCVAHRHRPAGPSWEVYGHWQREWDNAPSLIRTEIFYQLVPA